MFFRAPLIQKHGWPPLTRALARTEFTAGLTVALVMVPQAVAYAQLAGMPLVTGLYACLLPALLALWFGSATRLSVGPAALTCVLISASLNGLATPGSPEWVSLAVWLALISGAIQLGLGLGGYGWLLNLISAPVLMGFTQAAALLIMASQVPAMLGITHLRELWQPSALPLWPTAFGLGSLLLLLVLRAFKPRWPGIMLVVGGASLVSLVGDYANHGEVVGFLPSGLPAWYWPAWPGFETLNHLWMPAMVIALVSFLETASSARIECQRDCKQWDDNRELVGQGLAKVAAAFSGSFATSTSFSRSALMLYAGAQTAWAVVFCTVCVLIALVFFMPSLAYVPKAVLSAAVIAAVMNLFQPRQFIALWHISRAETITASLTFVITLLNAPAIYWGVLAGVLMTLAHFLYQRLHPRIIEIGLHSDGSLRDRHLWQRPPLAPHVYALRMDAELDFAAASALERDIVTHLSEHPDVRHVCLFAHPINRIDVTGVETMRKLESLLQERDITLHISGIKLPVETVLLRAGCLTPRDGLRMYRTDAEAVQALQRLHAFTEDWHI